MDSAAILKQRFPFQSSVSLKAAFPFKTSVSFQKQHFPLPKRRFPFQSSVSLQKQRFSLSKRLDEKNGSMHMKAAGLTHLVYKARTSHVVR